MSTSKELIIFGCSDGLLKIWGEIPRLIKEYDTFGLNYIKEYYEPLYHLGLDNPDLGCCIYKLENGIYQKHLKFIPNKTLFGCHTSASFAIDFAIKQGYNKVILYGILDGEYTRVKEHPYQLHSLFTYKHFYSTENQTKTLQELGQFKNSIFQHKYDIEIIIPNKTF
jgi:hypothetical protein